MLINSYIPIEQFKSVVDKFAKSEAWLKAPNSKGTKLTAVQWVQVRTPAFIEWFGDWINDPDNSSKVLDANGEPLVMYHGTSEYGFDEFDVTDDYGTRVVGSYFTDSLDVAKTYVGFLPGFRKKQIEKGNKNLTPSDYGVYETFLSINNPKTVDGKGANWTNFTSELDNSVYVPLCRGKYYFEYFNSIEDARRKAAEIKTEQNKEAVVEQNDPMISSTREFVCRAYYNWGYNGVIADNVYDVGSNSNKEAYKKPSKIVVALEPGQVRTATKEAFIQPCGESLELAI